MAQIPSFFGVNIGKNKIKVAQAKLSGNKANLEAISAVDSSVSLVSDESEKGIEELGKAIIECAKQAKVTTKNCIIAVPELLVFSRLLTLPKVNDIEIEDSIHWALKPLIPVPIEQVNISYLEIDKSRINNNDMVNWYTVAAPKNLIERYQKVCEKSGLNLLAIETEALAMTRLVYFNNQISPSQNILIVDIGAENTNLILARNSSVTFTQSISTGSNNMTKVIASDFGIDEIQAEKYKIAYGLELTEAEGKIAKALDPIMQIVVGEIVRTLGYLKEKIGGVPVSTIYLTGGGSGLRGIESYLSQKVGVNTVAGDPIKNFSISKGIETDVGSNHGREFNVVLGLSIKQY
jgi:type IV pilus assembly protein PilM